jgi:hypothetical protein
MTAKEPVAVSSAAATPVSSAPPAAAEKQPVEEGPPQKPSTVLTATDVAFLIDFAESDARRKAETSCDEEAKGDLAARGECLQKARDKFQPDVLRFTKEKQGRWSLHVYKRQDSTLKELYIGSVEFVDETPGSLRLKFTGRDVGRRPLLKSGSSPIQVPNNYSIEIQDPDLGKLVYRAKIGLVATP